MAKPLLPHHSVMSVSAQRGTERDPTVIGFLVRAALQGCAFSLCLSLCVGDYGDPGSFSVTLFKAVSGAHPMWHVGIAEEGVHSQRLQGTGHRGWEQATGQDWYVGRRPRSESVCCWCKCIGLVALVVSSGQDIKRCI